MTRAFSGKIFRFLYMKTSALAAVLGITINEGDVITDAMIIGKILTWQQLAIAGDVSEHKWMIDPLIQEQFQKHNRDDISSPGFEKPEGNPTVIHSPTFSTVHSFLLNSCFGKKIASSGNTDEAQADVNDSLTVLLEGGATLVSGDKGHFVQVGNCISVIDDVESTGPGAILTLKSKVTAKDGDTITVLDHWDPDIIDDDSYVVFAETSMGSRLISHVRFGLDYTTPVDDLLKLKLNYQGDVARKSNLVINTQTVSPELSLEAAGTVNYENNTKDMSTANFKRVTLGSVERLCVPSFNFELTREMTRLGCQATESGMGNGGTDRQKYMTKVNVTAYSKVLGTDYDANNYIMLLAQKPGFVIYAPVCQIRSEDPNKVNDNVQNVEYELAANTGQSQKNPDPITDLDPTKLMLII